MESTQLLSKAENILPQLINVRNHLHSYPELSFQEYKTQQFLKETLQNIGITNIKEIADTGLAVILESSNHGACIALRADMDALPIQEVNQTEYTSKNQGIMHACGHDVHMTALLGALQILHENKHRWQGKVLAIFQPGEELLPGGANKIIESNILKGNKAQLIIGQHVMPGMKTGETGFHAGAYMASTDELYINISGQGGHAATPELTKDTVSCAAETILSLKQEISNSAKDVPVILSIGKIDAPGSTNVIPSEIKMQGTFRTMDESFRKYAKTQMQTIVKRVANKYGVTTELIIKDGYPSLTNHIEYTNMAMDFMQELLGKHNANEIKVRMTGEDFAYYSQKMPAVFYRLGIANETIGHVNVHNQCFDIDNKALMYGAAGMAHLTMCFLKHLNP